MQQNGYGLKVNGSSMGLELSLRDFLRLPATDDDWHILDSWGPRQKNGIPAEETAQLQRDAVAVDAHAGRTCMVGTARFGTARVDEGVRRSRQSARQLRLSLVLAGRSRHPPDS